MFGNGKVIAQPAPHFNLPAPGGRLISLTDLLAKGSPLLIVFYPGDFKMVCTKQLCNYRDNLDRFKELGVELVGISPNPPSSHDKFGIEYDFPFLLLSDDDRRVAKAYGCTSFLSLGSISRAVFILNKQGLMLYRYVEPTNLTHRKAYELVGILQDLRDNKLI